MALVDLEDTFTEGASLDEALFNGTEVLSAMLGCRLDHDRPVPEPSPVGDGAYLIALGRRNLGSISAYTSIKKFTMFPSGSRNQTDFLPHDWVVGSLIKSTFIALSRS